MKIAVLDIPERDALPLDYPFTSPPSAWDLPEAGINVAGDIAGRMTLWRDQMIITITGEIATTVRLQCSRCLTDFTETLRPSFTMRCVPSATANADVSGALGGLEDDLYSYTGNLLDLRPMLREQVILAVPPYSVCHPDCRGLCQTCGENLNTSHCACLTQRPDQRLTQLKDLHKRFG